VSWFCSILPQRTEREATDVKRRWLDGRRELEHCDYEGIDPYDGLSVREAANVKRRLLEDGGGDEARSTLDIDLH
jgi:hypothetical protein